MVSVGDFVLPGEQISHLKESETTGKTILGPGLRRDCEDIVVTKPGKLRHREPNVYWVDCLQKRYVPIKGEYVLGIMTVKAGDVFRVDIGSSEQATLSFLAFEGATKKNRPDVKVGDLVYARLLAANKDVEPELVCVDSLGRSAGMGVIRDGGLLVTCPVNLVRKLLSPECPLLKTLGASLPFEVALGMNGRVWVKGRSTKETIAVANLLCSAEFMDNSKVKTTVRRLSDALTGF